MHSYVQLVYVIAMRGNFIRYCRSVTLATFSFKHLRVRYCYLLICSGPFCRNPPSMPGPWATGCITYSRLSLHVSTYTHLHTYTHYGAI